MSSEMPVVQGVPVQPGQVNPVVQGYVVQATPVTVPKGAKVGEVVSVEPAQGGVPIAFVVPPRSTAKVGEVFHVFAPQQQGQVPSPVSRCGGRSKAWERARYACRFCKAG